MKDTNGAEITSITALTPKPHHLKLDWDAADTTDKKLTVIAKALGIV